MTEYRSVDIFLIYKKAVLPIVDDGCMPYGVSSSNNGSDSQTTVTIKMHLNQSNLTEAYLSLCY
jgi:hypothetical protein